MAVSVSIEISRTFTISTDLDTVFELLADVPRSASHFPRVEQLTDLGENIYRWEMKKIGIDKHAIQTIYACKYTSSKEDGSILWTPVKSEGNGVVEGSWHLAETDGGVQCKFNTKGTLSLPLPGLLKLAISPVVKHEFNALVDTYVENLKTALES